MYNGYTEYFGLSDIPFSIAPNPRYLFMSARHKEALAHLTYGLGDVGGFALLTGEVGTGKTTVSKCLLKELPENTQAAFIVNPTLSAIELLATVCDELHVEYDSEKATLKQLTDLILNKLLENHQQGKHTLLIIDEAQHLQPQVLEQLRLLTNLETDTKKLLQVILIGQPELQELLKRKDLRQLAQRITARYHLMPLNKNEVKAYIAHRLNVAGASETIFKNSAINQIHKLSQGIPRLINLLCDRALLGAFAKEKKLVDSAIVNLAARETLGTIDAAEGRFKTSLKTITLSIALLSASVAGVYFGQQQLQVNQGKLLALENASLQAKAKHEAKKLNNIPNRLINQSRDFSQGFAQLFKHRKIAWQANDQPCQAALNFDLQCYWYQGSMQGLLDIGYPALLRFNDSKNQYYYATLTSVNGNKIELQLNGNSYWVSKNLFEQQYQGSAAILWQPPAGFIDVIDENSPIELVQWLEQKLSTVQQRPMREMSKFDALLANQAKQFQQRNQLAADNGVNSLTVIRLSNEQRLQAARNN